VNTATKHIADYENVDAINRQMPTPMSKVINRHVFNMLEMIGSKRFKGYS